MNHRSAAQVKQSPRLRRYAREASRLAALLLILLSARSSFADHYVVPTGSMLPTVHLGDHVVVNKLAYGLRVPFTHVFLHEGDAPARGDVVVLESPEDGIVLLKRVIALPGDRVAVREGRAVIGGVPVSVDTRGAGPAQEVLDGRAHTLNLDWGGGPDLPETVLPPDHILVLGDNRGNSKDGRSFGLVERRAILGRVAGVFLRDGAPTWMGLQ
ncbi:MAG: signal peptidase I [Deltaproteobacteria bacterium]|nr:signal peptidase I [Deltaproteobacteria bacterium]